MKAFKGLTSRAIPLDLDHVDTDMIIPAQYLTKVGREGFGEYLFKRLREQDVNFVLNDPRYQGLAILVTKTNFGCGSSREHAVWALLQAGIQVVIAESFSDIFFNNAAKNGLVTIVLSPPIISRLLAYSKSEVVTLQIDLDAQCITTSKEEIFSFEYDPFRKACLLQGQDDLDYLLEVTRA